jgi:hypothetical protein
MGHNYIHELRITNPSNRGSCSHELSLSLNQPTGRRLAFRSPARLTSHAPHWHGRREMRAREVRVRDSRERGMELLLSNSILLLRTDILTHHNILVYLLPFQLSILVIYLSLNSTK